MTTRRKLVRQRVRDREERDLEIRSADVDPTARPRWRRHTKAMEAMLKGVDPDRFELLGSGRI